MVDIDKNALLNILNNNTSVKTMIILLKEGQIPQKSDKNGDQKI